MSKLDPTRTSRIRRKFQTDLRNRFIRVKKKLIELIVKEDAFGLKKRDPFTFNTRFAFQSDAEKLDSFQEWIASEFQEEIIEEGMQNLEDAYWTAYINDAYKKGQGRAFDQVNKKSKSMQSKLDFFQGAKGQFLRESFGGPVAVDKVKLLAGRTLLDIKGVTEEMSKNMSRHLVDGLAQGLSPREVARRMSKEIDKLTKTRAMTIARTETIRAHAEGQLDAMEKMGVDKIGVAVEWSATGDDRTCPRCQPMDGVVYSLKEARGMLPLHPNCRCAYIPANVGETRTGQKRTKTAKAKAKKESVKAAPKDDESKLAKTKPKAAPKPDPKLKPKPKPSVGGNTFEDLRKKGVNVWIEDMPDNMNSKMVERYASLLNKYEDDFPGIFKGVVVKVEDLGPDVGGTFRKEFNERTLIMSKDTLVDPKHLTKVTKAAHKSGWLAGDSLESLLDHEVGHLVDFLPFNKVDEIVPGYSSANSYLIKNPPKAKDLSAYATTSKEEAFAEAWARVRSGKPLTKWEKGFKDSMIEGYKEAKKDVPEWLK